jgi:hypothetical protein
MLNPNPTSKINSPFKGGFQGILGLPGRLEITRCTEAEVLAVPRPEHPEACETEGVRAEGAEDARSVARRRVRREWGASTRPIFIVPFFALLRSLSGYSGTLGFFVLRTIPFTFFH